MSPRLTPLSWTTLDCIFIKAGFGFVRQSASHRIYFKEGCTRPLVVPTYKEVQTFVISGLLRTAGMSREVFFRFLDECR